jgi:hypothetical protein
VDGDAKDAWLNAAVRTDLSLPAGLLELLVVGRPRRSVPRPLTIKAAEPAAAEFWCDRGHRSLPCYRVRITGMREPCVALDPAVDLWWPPDHRENAATRTAATVDGATVHLPAWGGVRTEFLRAEFTEYETCVVGHPVAVRSTGDDRLSN